MKHVTVVKEDGAVKKAKNSFLTLAIIIGVVVMVAAVAVAVYKYLTPDYLDDFDEFDDDFDDDFFADDQEIAEDVTPEVDAAPAE